MPGQEQDVPVPALDGQRQPMEPGVILVATLVTQPHRRQEGLPQRLDLRCRQHIDALSNSHGPPNCGMAPVTFMPDSQKSDSPDTNRMVRQASGGREERAHAQAHERA